MSHLTPHLYGLWDDDKMSFLECHTDKPKKNKNGKVNGNNTKMGKSVDSAQATRFEAVPEQIAGLEIAPRGLLCICSW